MGLDRTPDASADRAEKALETYGYRSTRPAFGDLLTDLAHYAAFYGLDFAAEAACAVKNCAEERGEA